MTMYKVPMSPVSKSTYERMRKMADKDSIRACGFIVSVDRGNGRIVRRMYVTYENNYYTGTMLPHETLEDFMSLGFRGVETRTEAVFVPVAHEEQVA